MRVSFLVDGFNLYHSVKDVGGVGVRWLDLMSFCKSYLSSISPTATLNRVQYFSSLATHLQTYDPDTLNRQRAFISCLKDSGGEVTMEKFKKITVSSLWFPGNINFRLQIQRHEEKETDVAIAAHLIEQLADNTCDAAVLVTGDTDQAAGVRVAKRMFPQKRYSSFIQSEGKTTTWRSWSRKCWSRRRLRQQKEAIAVTSSPTLISSKTAT
ncbi:MAG: NYN domain-containing protein [Truepera sp.]|nr:NYN domain-containing protein [Truepera sp.]